jgi:hypothetical protein
MIKIAIVGVAPTETYFQGKLKTNPVSDFLELSQYSTNYTLTDPVHADFIICVDTIFFQNGQIPCSELIRKLAKYGNRLKFYDSSDQPRPVLTGGYTSLEKPKHIPSHNSSVPYIKNHSDIRVIPVGTVRDLLWSFSGSVGHASSKGYGIRNRLIKLQDAYSDVVETTTLPMWQYDKTALDAQRIAATNMSNQMQRSKYVACPRGGGASSFRFYEAIAHGSVPVLISDDWVLPDIPNLERAIIRLPESNVEEISMVLQKVDAEYPHRKSLVDSVYRDYLSPEMIFDTIVSTIIRCNPVNTNLAANIFISRTILRLRKIMFKTR